MKKLKYFSVLLLTLVVLAGCKNDNAAKSNDFYDKTFNWKITIPGDYEVLDQKEVNKSKTDGKDLLTDKNSAPAETTKDILVFKKDDANYFSANYEEYTGSEQFVDLRLKLKDFLILKNIGQIYPKGKMDDYSVSKENISGMEFRKAKIVLTEEGKTIATAVVFSRFFNGKIFVAAIVYEDELYGKAMIDLFKQSTFKK